MTWSIGQYLCGPLRLVLGHWDGSMLHKLNDVRWARFVLDVQTALINRVEIDQNWCKTSSSW